jgi:hypothetical protein
MAVPVFERTVVGGVPDIMPAGAEGSGFMLHQNTEKEICIPIPTPVILNNNRARVRAAQVLFNVDPPAFLFSVRVNDGKKVIFQKDSIQGVGDHSTPFDPFNRWEFQSDPIGFGLAITVLFRIGANPGAGLVAILRINAAGIDFDV